MAANIKACEDPFSILGLQVGASRSEIESAFRKRALKCHPDRNPKDPLARSKFQRLSRAKEVLLNPTAAAEARRKWRPNNANDVKSKGSSCDSKSKQATPNRAPDLRSARRREAEAQARKEAEERLRQREEEARKKRQREAEAEIEAKRRCAEMREDEEKQRKNAAEERKRAEIFESWLKHRNLLSKKHAKDGAKAGPQTARRSGC
eukprot:TRINITY_DN1062_c0_g2_i2.p1 TRINITY_DN1062_c0_g2~~TRINITY_DN1062_c0_g2_i2.p1  ORF type:complete len:206 (+),score=57.30 TRINITY_DN1062_c0_g2_i2:91-708(+)